ncbi:MAG: ParB/RepB/Spo0J family partition protein [Verrucomicrobia bacterium]|nr:ParB/RepB/Spo0J family partition protein [Verrucomicrobiota bacterium]
MTKSALGRGLGALLGGAAPSNRPVVPTPPPVQPELPRAAAESQAAVPAPPATAPDGRERVELIPLANLRPCPLQPRKDFAPDSIKELADSIREQGILQPLIVRARGGGFELIAGERRWRAAQSLGLADVPAIVREADDRKVLEMALIENLQRENLNPIEEAQGYAQLISQFQLTQESVSTQVGKSRVAVTNALRLLRLPGEVQSHVRNGLLSVGHAKVILGLPSPAEQLLAVDRVLKDGLNVRQTEELVAKLLEPTASITTRGADKGAKPVARDIHVVDLEHRLAQRFGTKVWLRYRKGKGAVEIKFYSDDELQRVLEVAGVKVD